MLTLLVASSALLVFGKIQTFVGVSILNPASQKLQGRNLPPAADRFGTSPCACFVDQALPIMWTLNSNA